jgi:uracil-DNA glycosylase family 4
MGPKTLELKALCATLGRKYVGFRGNPKAPLWLVGEGPGAEEDQLGVPFVGYSGRELDKMLVEAGISLNDCCFVNPYKVRPPDNDIERIEETGISRQIFEEQFREELNEYRPSFIVPLGGTSLRLLCPFTIDTRDKESKISKWRGSILSSDELKWPHYIIPDFHPAYILREWSDRDVAVFILRRVREEFDYWRVNRKHQPLPSRELIVQPSFDEAREFLKECIAHDGPTSVDIELLARRVPICIGLSFNKNRALSLEFFGYDREQSPTLWRLIENLLATKPIVGQNFSTFDVNWLNALGFDAHCRNLEDTLVRHHVLWPEMSHKLDFQVMQYTRQPFFKDEGKGWQLREGIKKLKRYNCLDSCCTLEVFEEQEKEFDERPELKSFYESYEMPLARAFHDIDKRGIQTDPSALKTFRENVVQELGEQCSKLSSNLSGRPVAFSAKMATALAKGLGVEPAQILNIGSVPQLKEVLKNDLKITLKKDRKTHKESTGEESLMEAFATTANPVLKHILRVRELNRMLGTYIDARLCKNIFYSCYSVTGTVTGRRSSRKSFLGFGSNGQNQPKHSDLGKKFRGVFIARPQKIFISCDQAQAEDWIVQGIIADVSGDRNGIEELRASIDRHQRLASQIFNLPLERCGKDANGDDTMERYLGKKTRHAGNYGMGADKMSGVLAAEGYSLDKNYCQTILNKFHEVEPNIRKIFHQWVAGTVLKKRRLTTPLGRQRDFFGIRPWGDNGKVLGEAYAYIPQSTVGDNTGLAILYCEQKHPGLVIADVHDAIVCEVDDNVESLIEAINLLKEAFDRTLTFQNGFQLKIPVDFQVGYSLKEMKKSSEKTLVETYENLKTQRSLEVQNC